MVFATFLLAASWQIALMALTGFASLSLASRQLVRVSRAFGEKMMTVNVDLSTLMLKTLQGMRILRSFAAEHRRQKRLEAASRRQTDAILRFTLIHNLLAPLTEVSSAALPSS